jgi:hypothetical protein
VLVTGTSQAVKVIAKDIASSRLMVTNFPWLSYMIDSQQHCNCEIIVVEPSDTGMYGITASTGKCYVVTRVSQKSDTLCK